MDKAMKNTWLEALRSGEYEQGRGRLCQVDGEMCCLGVLVDVEYDGEWTPDHFGYVICGADRTSVSYLPFDFREQAGLTPHAEGTLAEMNDRGDSFSEIADWIEANL